MNDAQARRWGATAGFGVLAAQVSINVGAALGKGLFSQVGPEGVAALRTSIAAIVLLAIARPWAARLDRGQVAWLVLYGLALGGMNLLIYWAIERIPIGIAVTIEVSGPLVVVLLGSRSARDLLWLALAATGVLLLVPWPGAGAALDAQGVLYAAGAAFCWALYILFGKRASQVESTKAVALGMVVACLVTVPSGLSAAGSELFSVHVLSLGLVVALLSSALPYLLEMKALERLTSRVFGLVTSSAPAIAALVGFIMLGERLAIAQWVAVALMVAASAGASISARSSQRPSQDAAAT
ncbi:EamA family transporter [Phenylobacterium sp.]|uniref:EamA family transporter n=1 Tax=Phenylobacterium sp. TaxID=1871053 RepID=UPI00301C1D2C